jgi:hypothetical protein
MEYRHFNENDTKYVSERVRVVKHLQYFICKESEQEREIEREKDF